MQVLITYIILHTGVIKVNVNILGKDDMIEIVRGKVSMNFKKDENDILYGEKSNEKN